MNCKQIAEHRNSRIIPGSSYCVSGGSEQAMDQHIPAIRFTLSLKTDFPDEWEVLLDKNPKIAYNKIYFLPILQKVYQKRATERKCAYEV